MAGIYVDLDAPTGGGGDTCTIVEGISTTKFGWDTGSTSTKRWNATNTGWNWTLELATASITELCGRELSTALPLSGGITGGLTLASATINYPDSSSKSITGDVTATPSGQTIALSDDTVLLMPDVLATSSHSISITLLINGSSPVTITRSLTYTAPSASVSISTPNLLFDGGYTSATISRVFGNGSPTSTTSTAFPNATVAAGATSITFPELDKASDAADRLVTEVTSYTNATDITDIQTLTRTATLNPTFQYPAYLLSANKTTGFTTVEVNSSQASGLFTTVPGDQDFTWNDPSDDSLINKVFFVRNSWRSGTLTAYAYDENDMRSLVGAAVPLAGTISVGDRSDDLETYSYYIIATGQPGGIKYHLDF